MSHRLSDVPKSKLDRVNENTGGMNCVFAPWPEEHKKQTGVDGCGQMLSTQGGILDADLVESTHRTWDHHMEPGPIMGVDPISENPPVVMSNSSMTGLGGRENEEGQVIQEFTLKLPKTDLPDGKVIVTVLTSDTQITDGVPRDFNDPLVREFFTFNKD